MIDKNTTEYLERLGNVRLSSGVKAQMREELSSYVDFHTASAEALSQSAPASVTFFAYFTRPLQTTFAVMFVLLGTTGISFGAQDALPGDALYGVKVLVQEKIQASLAFDADAQAKVQGDIFAERLAEARKLMLEGKKDIATSNKVRTAINAQREKALSAAANASSETQIALQTDVVADYTYTQKILTASRPVFASAQGVSTSATEPSQARSAILMDTSSFGMGGGAEDTASMLTADAKMMPEYVGFEPVAEGELILPALSERVAFLQTALRENTVAVSPEIKSEIEKDLTYALTLWYGTDQERAYELVSYIEEFLSVSLQGEPSADIPYMDMGSDGEIIKSMPIPMPMPTDTGLYTEPGFGIEDNSGIRTGGEIDLMYTEDMGQLFDSGIVDMGMEVQSLSEVAQ